MACHSVHSFAEMATAYASWSWLGARSSWPSVKCEPTCIASSSRFGSTNTSLKPGATKIASERARPAQSRWSRDDRVALAAQLGELAVEAPDDLTCSIASSKALFTATSARSRSVTTGDVEA